MGKGRRVTNNALLAQVDVDIKPVKDLDQVQLTPIDCRGNALKIVTVGYQGPLPNDDMPATLLISNGKVNVTYTHRAVPDMYLAKARSSELEARKWREEHDAVLADIVALSNDVAVEYRRSWLVKAAANVVAWCHFIKDAVKDLFAEDRY